MATDRSCSFLMRRPAVKPQACFGRLARVALLSSVRARANSLAARPRCFSQPRPEDFGLSVVGRGVSAVGKFLKCLPVGDDDAAALSGDHAFAL